MAMLNNHMVLCIHILWMGHEWLWQCQDWTSLKIDWDSQLSAGDWPTMKPGYFNMYQ